MSLCDLKAADTTVMNSKDTESVRVEGMGFSYSHRNPRGETMDRACTCEHKVPDFGSVGKLRVSRVRLEKAQRKTSR